GQFDCVFRCGGKKAGGGNITHIDTGGSEWREDAALRAVRESVGHDGSVLRTGTAPRRSVELPGRSGRSFAGQHEYIDTDAAVEQRVRHFLEQRIAEPVQ